MAESFPAPPGGSAGSFPQGHEPRDDAPMQSSSALLFRRYRVIRELGRGGMGVVLLAHDTALDIPVAVKLVPDLVVKDSEAIADLRKEVLRGMALNHDGVVRTHHFEKDESGAGIVMEFVEGHTLTDLKVQQPGGCFDPEQIVGWLEQLCAVLDYAHRDKRIVHRDLKPRNIMVTPAGRVKVADFGIAALISDSMSRHSMEGTVSGTLSYMSPQQAQGMKPTPLDDIHALGATLYELLTGKPPFFRGNPLMIQTQVITAVPPPLAERREELEVVGRAAIPPHWEATIAVCLAKEPEDRPRSAGDVLARLKAAPLAASLRAAPPSEVASSAELPAPTSHSAAATARRSLGPLTSGALAALALVTGGAYYFTMDRGVIHSATPTTPRLISAERTPPSAPVPTPMPSTPAPPGPAERLVLASKDAPFENSLGMKFVPAGTLGLLFCVWETRMRDFDEFVTRGSYDMKKGEKAYTFESGGWKQAGGDWRNPRFPVPQSPDHPVVCVSLNDAKAFCVWLTTREQQSGMLPAGARYRLPTDQEWSAAVGDSTYPWGDDFPPRQPVGNYAGIESKVGAAKDVEEGWTIIAGYNDRYSRTAPVGSFAPNGYGLYDLGGNVWEWCDTIYKPSLNSADALNERPGLKEERSKDGKPFNVIRGASWKFGEPLFLRSNFRNYDSPSARYAIFGFRVALVISEG